VASPSILKRIGDILVCAGSAVLAGLVPAGLLAGSGCASVPVRTNAAEEPATSEARRGHDTQTTDAGIKVAKTFWTALAAGDTEGMAEHYADEVVVWGSSELLKTEWGLPGGGDRSRDVKVRKADLLRAYESFIESVGRERWRDLCARIDDDKISFITVAVADWADTFERLVGQPLPEFRKSLNERKAAGQTLADLHVGDLVMGVDKPDPDGMLFFQLRQTTSGKWQVVGEATDY